MFNETIVANGPTVVARGMLYDPGDGHVKIDTEILSMNLVGVSVYLGQITIIQSPFDRSYGAIQRVNVNADFPACSFFDVFVAIQTVVGTFHTNSSTHMEATINSIPPWGATYAGPPNRTDLVNGTGAFIGWISHVCHEIGPMPVPVGGFAVSVTSASADMPRSRALYVGSVSMIFMATFATAIYVRHAKHKKSVHQELVLTSA